jgi:hypothetical protein
MIILIGTGDQANRSIPHKSAEIYDPQKFSGKENWIYMGVNGFDD